MKCSYSKLHQQNKKKVRPQKRHYTKNSWQLPLSDIDWNKDSVVVSWLLNNISSRWNVQLFHEKRCATSNLPPKCDNGAYFPVISLEKKIPVWEEGGYEISFSIFFVLSYHYTHLFLLVSQSKLTLDFDKNNIVIPFWFWKWKKKETQPVGKDHPTVLLGRRNLVFNRPRNPRTLTVQTL